jgi:fructokinase
VSRGRRAVVFGETVVDLYPDEEVVAGSPLHVAAHLARAGWRVWLVTRIGRDRHGERIRAAVEAQGIDASLVEIDPELPSGSVTVEARGETNAFRIHGPAAWDRLAGPDSLPEHDAFSYGTLVGRSPTARATLARLLRRSRARHRVLDLNLRPPDVDAGVLRATLASATAVKMSEEELDHAGGLLRLAPSPARFLQALPHLEWLCITRGGRGAELHGRRGSARIGAPPVPVVNTVGAGDAFAAGLIDGLSRGAPPEETLATAHAWAASVLGRRGALPQPADGALG